MRFYFTVFSSFFLGDKRQTHSIFFESMSDGLKSVCFGKYPIVLNLNVKCSSEDYQKPSEKQT